MLLLSLFATKGEITMKINEMEERARKLHQHIQENPADYTAVIAELKLRSDIIDKERHNRMNERLKEVARIRRKNEEQRQRNRNG